MGTKAGQEEASSARAIKACQANGNSMMCFKKYLYGTSQDVVQRDETGCGEVGAEPAEHQVGTADKVVHRNTAVCDFCSVNHLCSPVPGSSDSSKALAQAVNRV